MFCPPDCHEPQRRPNPHKGWGAAIAALLFAIGMLSDVTPAASADSSRISAAITVWSWNIAAEALAHLVPDFNKNYPDIKVTVVNMGHSDVRDRALAECAAGGEGLADVITIEDQAAEQFWKQFPDCFKDLNTLGYRRMQGAFPDFETLGLSMGGKAYAMPWDSGPSVVFYRRDLFEKAGIDPASVLTWRDFIEAGKKLKAATGGRVAMIQDDKGGDDVLFRQLAVQNRCFYFSPDGTSITVAHQGCVEALQVIKEMWDAGIVSSASWDQKIQSLKAGLTATQVYGGWYEGTIRTNAPEQAGKWGLFHLPAFEPGGNRASATGGSSLAISAKSRNPAAAFAFMSYALATPAGQISMLRYRGLIPALLSAANDPYVLTPQPYWGGQSVWADLLATLGKIPSYRATPYFSEAIDISKVEIGAYLEGRYPNARAALDAVAEQLAASTGLPISR